MEHFVERTTVDQLHRDIGDTIGFADVVDGGDIGMAERTGGARLTQEARAQFGVADELGFQQFDRDGPPDIGIACAKHVGHGAFAKPVFDFVTA